MAKFKILLVTSEEVAFLQYTIVFKEKIINNLLNTSLEAVIALKIEVITVYPN